MLVLAVVPSADYLKPVCTMCVSVHTGVQALQAHAKSEQTTASISAQMRVSAFLELYLQVAGRDLTLR